MKTHDVLNQTPPMSGLNAYLGDPLLMQITKRFPQEVRKELEQNGRFVLSSDAQDLAKGCFSSTTKAAEVDSTAR